MFCVNNLNFLFSCGFSGHEIPVRRNINQIAWQTLLSSHFQKDLIPGWTLFTAKQPLKCLHVWAMPMYQAFLGLICHLANVSHAVVVKNQKHVNQSRKNSGRWHLKLNFIMFFSDFIHSDFIQASNLITRRIIWDLRSLWGNLLNAN